MKESIEMPSAEKKEAKSKKFDKYEIEGAFHDLTRAEEHKKNPALMKEIHKHAKSKLKDIRSIADLRHAANTVDKAEDDNQ